MTPIAAASRISLSPKGRGRGPKPKAWEGEGDSLRAFWFGRTRFLSGPPAARSDLFVAPFEFGDLALGLVARDAVALLDLADELVALPLDLRPVAVGELAPLLLGLAGELLP